MPPSALSSRSVRTRRRAVRSTLPVRLHQPAPMPPSAPPRQHVRPAHPAPPGRPARPNQSEHRRRRIRPRAQTLKRLFALHPPITCYYTERMANSKVSLRGCAKRSPASAPRCQFSCRLTRGSKSRTGRELPPRRSRHWRCRRTRWRSSLGTSTGAALAPARERPASIQPSIQTGERARPALRAVSETGARRSCESATGAMNARMRRTDREALSGDSSGSESTLRLAVRAAHDRSRRSWSRASGASDAGAATLA